MEPRMPGLRTCSVLGGVLLAAACAGHGAVETVAPISLPFEADRALEDSAFTIRGHFFGHLYVDSLTFVVDIDSVTLDSPKPFVLGAIGAGFGRRLPNGHWDIYHGVESRYLILDSAIAPGRALVLNGLRLSGARTAAAPSLNDGWLVFTLVIGRIPGTPGSPGIGTVYMHSRRDLLSGVTIPKIAASAARGQSPNSGMTGPQLIPTSCGPFATVPKGAMIGVTVDTLGLVDPTMIRPLNAAARSTPESVRQELAHCRFEPARLDGRVVRMDVAIPF
jgi:hypothetical protein